MMLGILVQRLVQPHPSPSYTWGPAPMGAWGGHTPPPPPPQQSGGYGNPGSGPHEAPQALHVKTERARSFLSKILAH